MPDPVLTGPPITSTAEFGERLAAIQRALAPPDGLAYFNSMYSLVTAAVIGNLDQSAFTDAAWMTALDVTFGNLYLDALRASVQSPSAVSRAWAAVFERRTDTRVAPLQFALAGMNAHINRDLPVAICSTCRQLATSPDAGAHHADFERINPVLASAEPGIRQSVEDAFATQVFPGLQDVVANFDMVKARETAWTQARSLWFLQQISPLEGNAFLTGLDHLTGFAGRGLLVPLRQVF